MRRKIITSCNFCTRLNIRHGWPIFCTHLDIRIFENNSQGRFFTKHEVGNYPDDLIKIPKWCPLEGAV
jgi:hypothetical protein